MLLDFDIEILVSYLLTYLGMWAFFGECSYFRLQRTKFIWCIFHLVRTLGKDLLLPCSLEHVPTFLSSAIYQGESKDNLVRALGKDLLMLNFWMQLAYKGTKGLRNL